MSKSIAQRRRTSKGSAMVEAAFIFLVFFCLLIGAFDFGQFLFIHQALVERARYAVRWGAVNLANDETTATSTIQNVVLYNATTGSGTGYFGLTASNVDVTKTTDRVCAASGAQPSLFVRFTVKIHDYQYQILSPYIAGTYTGPYIIIGSPVEQDFSTSVSACA